MAKKTGNKIVNGPQNPNLISSWNGMFRPYFSDMDKNGNPILPKNAYVLFLDIMGMQGVMKSSLQRSANFIFKFHTVLEKYKTSDLVICPVMDGAYIATISDNTTGENDEVVPNRPEASVTTTPAASTGKNDEVTLFNPMYDFIKKVFCSLAADFTAATRYEFQYLVRGALSFGKIVFGHSIPQECFDKAVTDPTKCPDWNEYKTRLIIGAPVISAHLGEKKAPPFGIYVDEALREVVFKNFLGTSDLHPWLWWWKDLCPVLFGNFTKAVKDYFTAYKKHSYSSEYELPNISKQEGQFDDYTTP